MQGSPQAVLGYSVVLFAALLACKAGKDDSSAGASKAETKPAKTEAAKPAEAKPTGPELTATSLEIAKEYKANEARADAKFKGKVIEISGTVTGIDSGITDEPIVKLESDNQFLGVSLHDVDKETAIALNKGDKVTFICVGAGEMMGSPMLNECRKK